MFQCSSASRKFLNLAEPSSVRPSTVGFSALQRAENSSMEGIDGWSAEPTCFSALQRAENSSIDIVVDERGIVTEFQCSSASRKFLNRYSQRVRRKCVEVSVLFSEPKIPQSAALPLPKRANQKFQCSSASRKFLNCVVLGDEFATGESFSALQRAENSSIFSPAPRTRRAGRPVSVLFSEPKIPQFGRRDMQQKRALCFSALQRAENSSI